MDLRDFWYIAAESREVRGRKPVQARILDEWIALFRGEDGQVAALQDRCVHRCAQLSRGTVSNGRLVCPYHGWTYDPNGQVVHVPSEGKKPCSQPASRRARTYFVRERDGYVYVCVAETEPSFEPFAIPMLGRPGWSSIRLKNAFDNGVTNCVENFVDIPHTVSVHPGIFRVKREEHYRATVVREGGSVHVTYAGERANLGYFSRFLNPSGEPIRHTDSFHMPNITSVHYDAGEKRQFIITSQSVPSTDDRTIVFTDLTYDYGIWSRIARPIIRNQATRIIDQDIEILGNQMETISRFGSKFMNSEADVIHVLIESIRKELEEGRDPRNLPKKSHEIEFWV